MSDAGSIMLQVVFTMVFTCPWYAPLPPRKIAEAHSCYAACSLWAIIRFCRDYASRRKMVVLPEKKIKKKPDIAVASGKAVQRTQAEILAEQRERVKNLHGVGEKKLKPKAPKRKGPPQKKS
ncbi:hypothetical protein V7S43_011062 [Phytophthora oleae]|uniref:Uncharacterized protein n=1 Tax=Phytophthora oleae TaxID=2107226 RepID=A0ABD3FCN7_9STRA